MTLQEILTAIEEFGNDFVSVTLTENRIIRCVLRDAYPGHPQDPRGYIEPYFFVDRIDTNPNRTEKYNCAEALEITRI
jgi:hypothetical protein